MTWNITITVKRCLGCGECADVCPVGVYTMRGGAPAPLDKSACIGCQACVEVCPGGCIKVAKK